MQEEKNTLEFKDFVSRLNKSIGKESVHSVAKRAQINYSTMHKYTTGEAVPTITKLGKISKVLDVSLDWLVSGENSKSLEHQASRDYFEQAIIIYKDIISRHKIRIPKKMSVTEAAKVEADTILMIYDIISNEKPATGADWGRVVNFAEEKLLRSA